MSLLADLLYPDVAQPMGNGVFLVKSPAKWRGAVTILGPAPFQGSKKVFMAGSRPIIVEDSRKSLGPWRETCRRNWALIAPPKPLETPVSVRLTVFVARPKSHFGTGKNACVLKDSAPECWSTSLPDLDKVQRAVGDCLAGIVIRDDRLIAMWDARRLYADGVPPRVEILVEEL